MGSVNYYRNHYLNIGKTYPSSFALKCFLGNNPELNLSRLDFSGKKICDIGFGDGRDLNLFLDLKMDVFGVEPDSTIVNHTKKKFYQNIQLNEKKYKR